MVDSLLEALDRWVPAEAVRGLDFKGSASMPWHAPPCDYVPEPSDLDLHLWLHEDASAEFEERFQDTRFALMLAADVEATFRRRVPQPLHQPRSQVLILNEAQRRSPSWSRSHAEILRGAPYPGTDPTALEDRETLLAGSAGAAALGLSFMDKLGPEVKAALRAVGWRVSSLAARLLGALGAGSGVWAQPRSLLFPDLRECGCGDVADALDAYFGHAWAAFSSGWQDAVPMREAVLAGLDALALAAAQVKRTL